MNAELSTHMGPALRLEVSQRIYDFNMSKIFNVALNSKEAFYFLVREIQAQCLSCNFNLRSQRTKPLTFADCYHAVLLVGYFFFGGSVRSFRFQVKL